MTNTPRKIGVVSLGCPKNLVDTEVMLGLIEKKGFEIDRNASECDVIIVNTCGFIESAVQESINTILEMAEFKKDKCKLLIVTGCLSERYREKIQEEIPEVDFVTGVSNYGSIADYITANYPNPQMALFDIDDDISYLENKRVISTGKAFAYLKIAEGCDNCCSYCIIPQIRGRYRSRPIEAIIEEASRLAEMNIPEIVLIAQDTTKYGTDLYGKPALTELLRGITGIASINRVRILYTYPDGLTDELVDEIARNPKICNYVDLPLQHINARILETMGRPNDSDAISGLIGNLRERIPGMVIRTTFITGFPGETDEEFGELFAFVKKIKFDKLGVFCYSREAGTKAAKLPSQVRQSVKVSRRDKLMVLQSGINDKLLKRLVGSTFLVIIEGIADDGILYYGRSYREAPDIDGCIYLTSSEPLEPGDTAAVRIIKVDGYDLIGVRLKN